MKLAESKRRRAVLGRKKKSTETGDKVRERRETRGPSKGGQAGWRPSFCRTIHPRPRPGWRRVNPFPRLQAGVPSMRVLTLLVPASRATVAVQVRDSAANTGRAGRYCYNGAVRLISADQWRSPLGRAQWKGSGAGLARASQPSSLGRSWRYSGRERWLYGPSSAVPCRMRLIVAARFHHRSSILPPKKRGWMRKKRRKRRKKRKTPAGHRTERRVWTIGVGSN